MGDAAQALPTIQSQIQKALYRSGRAGGSVRLVGVSKKQPLEKILALAQAGLVDFGENYVQEWKGKKSDIEKNHPELNKIIHWHFIGHLQSNKAKELVGKIEYIHALDSLKLAQRISQHAAQLGITQKVLMEINLEKEVGKFGFERESLLRNLSQLARLPGLSLEGLMAIPPPASGEKSRPYFKRLKSLLDECNQSGNLTKAMKELSMGMSNDFEVAIEEGATMIRIGTALFGPRL